MVSSGEEDYLALVRESISYLGRKSLKLVKKKILIFRIRQNHDLLTDIKKEHVKNVIFLIWEDRQMLEPVQKKSQNITNLHWIADTRGEPIFSIAKREVNGNSTGQDSLPIYQSLTIYREV